jgi:hypothetical protein
MKLVPHLLVRTLSMRRQENPFSSLLIKRASGWMDKCDVAISIRTIKTHKHYLFSCCVTQAYLCTNINILQFHRSVMCTGWFKSPCAHTSPRWRTDVCVTWLCDLDYYFPSRSCAVGGELLCSCRCTGAFESLCTTRNFMILGSYREANSRSASQEFTRIL